LVDQVQHGETIAGVALYPDGTQVPQEETLPK
jgi:hypothetical protein